LSGVDPLVDRAVVRVALHRERVDGAAPVKAEPALALVPGVLRAAAVNELRVVAAEALGIDPVTGVLAELAAVTRSPGAFLVARAQTHEAALGVLRAARDDVDDTVHRVRAPQRATGPTDHLDALDVLEHHVLHSQKTRIQRRVDGAAVNHHEELVAVVLLKPRAEIAYWLESTRATSKFGASRSASGRLVAPERRISSLVMTYMAAAALASGSERLETEVTSMSDNSSSDMRERSTAGDGPRDPSLLHPPRASR